MFMGFLCVWGRMLSYSVSGGFVCFVTDEFVGVQFKDGDWGKVGRRAYVRI